MEAAQVRSLVREMVSQELDPHGLADLATTLSVLRRRIDRLEKATFDRAQGAAEAETKAVDRPVAQPKGTYHGARDSSGRDVPHASSGAHSDGTNGSPPVSPRLAPKGSRAEKMPPAYIHSPSPSIGPSTPREMSIRSVSEERRRGEEVPLMKCSDARDFNREIVEEEALGHGLAATGPAAQDAVVRLAARRALDIGSDEGEQWEFDADSYSLGLVALTKRGVAGAVPHLFLALLTPTLQGICFIALFNYMMSQDADNLSDLGGEHGLVNIVCFILMGLDLTNEVLEGYQKMMFSCRCVAGIYEGTRAHVGCIALVLGMLQAAVPCYIVGLSMKLVSVSDSVLDAFMNYVALLFITQIDNCLTSSRMIANIVPMETTVRMRLKADAVARAKTGQEPWTLRMMLCMNVVSVVMITLNYLLIIMLWRTGASPDKVVDPQWCRGQVPSFLIVLFATNGAMYLGSRRCGATNVAVPMSLVSQLLVITIYLVDMHHQTPSWMQPWILTTNQLLLNGLIGIATSAGSAIDPFNLIKCPVRLPLIAWLVLIGCTLWIEHTNAFGYA